MSTIIELFEVEQIWQDETTRHWFKVFGSDEGSVFGVAHSCGEHTVIDEEGHPINQRNIDPGLYDQLIEISTIALEAK